MKKRFIKSYAKINLSLDVFGKYKSNYHKIQSIISFIDLYDEIYISQINKKKHLVKFNGPFSKNLNKNTISNLLNLLDQKKILKKRYEILIKKNIPQKSGLGGGSMNAACVLKFFLKNKIIQITNQEIYKICSEIGSDVFIGLDRKNSILINKNTIKRYNLKIGLFAILVKPKIGCSTKKIYNRVKISSKKKINSSSKVFKISSLKKQENDLEKPAFKLYPILGKLKNFLSNTDQVEFVRMTGSGSTIVAYFSNKKSALNALKLVRKNFKNYWSILSKTI